MPTYKGSDREIRIWSERFALTKNADLNNGKQK